MQKQKEKNSSTAAKENQNIQTEIPSGKKKKSSADILEEMFGMKIELPEPQEAEAPKNYSENVKEETWDPVKEFDEVYEKPESDYELKNTAKKSELSANSQKHRAFKEEKIDADTLVDVLGVQKLFSKQANLKDYIKVQEILNKPKALRR
jgi:hypothetical protein